MAAGLLLASTLLPAAYQAAQGFIQRKRAKDLKESTWVPPELLMNRDLASQQAYSRRAPGQSQAEENIRRNLATTISASNRSFGGDANKAAAVAGGAAAQADDQVRRLQANGQQFSENAFARMANANQGIAGQKRQNRDEFNRTKSELIAASDQNFFNAISGVGSAGVAFGLNGGFGGKGKGGSSTIPAAGGMAGNPASAPGYDPNNAYSRFLPFDPYSNGGGNPMDPNNMYPSWRKPYSGPKFAPSPAMIRR